MRRCCSYDDQCDHHARHDLLRNLKGRPTVVPVVMSYQDDELGEREVEHLVTMRLDSMHNTGRWDIEGIEPPAPNGFAEDRIIEEAAWQAEKRVNDALDELEGW